MGSELANSFTAFVKAKQAPAWAGSVTDACKNAPFVKAIVHRMITNQTKDDIKFSKMFWKGALELNMAIGRGKNSRFAKFIGKKILGKVMKIKVKVGKKAKAGLKLKVKAKKPKAGLKLKIKAKKPKVKAGLKLKVKAKKPVLKLKVKAKKPVVKAKAGLKLKVKAKKSRRMQAVASTGVNVNDPKFAANV